MEEEVHSVSGAHLIPARLDDGDGFGTGGGGRLG